jgi:hypothetical protein
VAIQSSNILGSILGGTNDPSGGQLGRLDTESLLGGIGNNSVLEGLVSNAGVAGLFGGDSPLTIVQTPDGQNVESVGVSFLGLELQMHEGEDAGGGALPPVGPPGDLGSDLTEDFGGRSTESITLSGPVGFTADFANAPSHNTESEGTVADQPFDTQVLSGFTDNSLQSISTTGPVALEILFESGGGSATATSVEAGNLLGGTFLDGPGGNLESITLSEPVDVSVVFDDSAGIEGFPLVVGDEGLQGALLAGFGRTGIEDVTVEGIGAVIDHGGDGPAGPGFSTGEIVGSLGGTSAVDTSLLDGLLA